MQGLSDYIFKKFLYEHNPVGHNLDSYDQSIRDCLNFIDGREWIQNAKEGSTNEVSYKITLKNPRLQKPVIHNQTTLSTNYLTPRDCIERKMSYEGDLITTVCITLEGSLNNSQLRETFPEVDVHLMSIPIPVGSRYCNSTNHQDPEILPLLGCFIVKGQKKNIISFECASVNHPMLFHSNEFAYYSEIRSHSVPVDMGQCYPDTPSMSLTVYSNVVFFNRKKRILLFQSRSFKGNRTKCVSLVNILTNLGLYTEHDLRNALLGPDPSDELKEALASTFANPDDLPLPSTIEQIHAKFGSIPTMVTSHLGRKSSSTVLPPTITKHDQWRNTILQREILPHCGTNNQAKIYILCQMARRVALANYQSERGLTIRLDNRDNLMNKYIKGYGDLMTELFLDGIKRIRESVNKAIRRAEKEQRPPSMLTKQTFPSIVGLPWTNSETMKTITNGQINNRPRGKMVIKTPTRTGLTQNFTGLNLSALVSFLRNIKNPINKQSRDEDIRQIQAGSFGYYCPSETHEGQDVGLDNALSMQATTTLSCSVQVVLDVCKQFSDDPQIIFPFTEDPIDNDYTIIMINGFPSFIIDHDYTQDFVDYFRTCRRNGLLDIHTSIVHGQPNAEKDQEIHIHTNPGRLSAAYLIIDQDGVPLLQRRFEAIETLRQLSRPEHPEDTLVVEKMIQTTFQELFQPLILYFQNQEYTFPASLEWIDTYERNDILLSESVDKIQNGSTHAMIHPSLILGSSASEVPFPDHNQSPRNAYQCGMGKQSIAGRPIVDINDSHIAPYLLYPQRPLVMTSFTRALLDRNPCPAGTNGVVAIMSWLYNQEDAIIINEASLQRGMYATIHFDSYSDCARNTGLHYDSGFSQADKFGYPDPDKVCHGVQGAKRFDHIDENGFAIAGSVVRNGDPLIVRLRCFHSSSKHECINTYFNRPCTREYASCITYYKGNDLGVVDRVQVTTNDKGDHLVNIIVRTIRTPNVGDKLASRHAQKGVIGRVVAQRDLPFSVVDGITPDIIINPHAIPSRMTVAHLIETLAGMLTCVSGQEIDATSFSNNSMTPKMISKELHRRGYHSMNEQRMICGMTGDLIEGSIFMGPIFYQRMKQMAVEKAHARSTGSVVQTTRQPPEGRSRLGGLRVGEMERDCVISHGASSIVQERLMFSSDPYKMYVCDQCGNSCTGNADENKRIFQCDTCGNKDTTRMSIVEIPYAAKLLYQEVTGLRVNMKIETENSCGF